MAGYGWGLGTYDAVDRVDRADRADRVDRGQPSARPRWLHKAYRLLSGVGAARRGAEQRDQPGTSGARVRAPVPAHQKDPVQSRAGYCGQRAPISELSRKFGPGVNLSLLSFFPQLRSTLPLLARRSPPSSRLPLAQCPTMSVAAGADQYHASDGDNSDAPLQESLGPSSLAGG